MTRAPWTYPAALDAIALRRLGMSYSSIGIAVQHYHGFRPGGDSVSHICRKAGIPATRPANNGSFPRATA